MLQSALQKALPQEFALQRADHFNPLIKNRQTRDREVGDFFAQLTREVFDGQLLSQTGTPSPDAYLRALAAYTEIKGRNDANAIPLKELQLERYLEIGDSSERPPTFVYMLWRYRSKDKGNAGVQRNLLTHFGKRRDVLRWFLARTTHTCHLFDIGVIETIRKTMGVKNYTWPSYESTPVVYLPPKLIYGLHEGTIGDISPRLRRRYRKGSFRVNFLYEEAVMSFTIHAILLPKTYRRLQAVAKRLNGQLFMTES